MNFIKAILKDNIKKGFTIVEILMTVSIAGMIMAAGITVMFKYMKLNRVEINNMRDYFYVNEAFMIIKSQIDSAQYIKIEDNKIMLKRYDNKGIDYIKTGKTSNIVLSYGYTNFNTNNSILKDVFEFQVLQYGNMCHINIKTKRGNVYNRCFGIERQKIREDIY